MSETATPAGTAGGTTGAWDAARGPPTGSADEAEARGGAKLRCLAQVW